MNRPEKSTAGNLSSEKLLGVMEALSLESEPIRLQDLARQLDMNPSTLLRFLGSLQNRGYVAQEEESGRYYMTYKICNVANNIIARVGIGRICLPYLRSISQIFDESANLSIEQNMQMVYIEVINGPHQMLVTRQRIGNIAPMHCTGVGKLMLLNYSDQQIDELIARRGLQKFTENTFVTKETLCNELQRIRRQDYAFDNEECEVGARCIAAPIRNYTGKIVAGISVSGPSTRMSDGFIYEKLSFLLDAAGAISGKLGYVGGGGS